jgi:hypothetical protein
MLLGITWAIPTDRWKGTQQPNGATATTTTYTKNETNRQRAEDDDKRKTTTNGGGDNEATKPATTDDCNQHVYEQCIYVKEVELILWLGGGRHKQCIRHEAIHNFVYFSRMLHGI